jgi:glycolate oxidase FAD binding subunit
MADEFAPKSEAEYSDAIAHACAARRAVELCGFRSKEALGRPMEPALRVSAAGLRGVTFYEPRELVISARAGTSLAEIEAALDRERQELPFEPADFSGALGGGDGEATTIGSVIAMNASGPRRVSHGAARDYVLGVRAVNGLGEVIQSGGRVMKNVTGLDLARALTGSWGTLAAITEVTLKVLPRAEESRTLVFLNLPDEAAVIAMCMAMGASCGVTGTIHLQTAFVPRLADHDLKAAGQSVTALRIEGLFDFVDGRARKLAQRLAAFGKVYELNDHRSRAFWSDARRLGFLTKGDPAWPLWRLSAAPDQASGMVSALSALMECNAVYEWSGGLVWLETPPARDASATTLRRVIGEFGGGAMLVRADAAVRASVEVFQPLPLANMALTKRLKAAFDPHGVLNPGRMYEGV